MSNSTTPSPYIDRTFGDLRLHVEPIVEWIYEDENGVRQVTRQRPDPAQTKSKIAVTEPTVEPASEVDQQQDSVDQTTQTNVSCGTDGHVGSIPEQVEPLTTEEQQISPQEEVIMLRKALMVATDAYEAMKMTCDEQAERVHELQSRLGELSIESSPSDNIEQKNVRFADPEATIIRKKLERRPTPFPSKKSQRRTRRSISTTPTIDENAAETSSRDSIEAPTRKIMGRESMETIRTPSKLHHMYVRDDEPTPLNYRKLQYAVTPVGMNDVENRLSSVEAHVQEIKGIKASSNVLKRTQTAEKRNSSALPLVDVTEKENQSMASAFNALAAARERVAEIDGRLSALGDRGRKEDEYVHEESVETVASSSEFDRLAKKHQTGQGASASPMFCQEQDESNQGFSFR